MDPEQVSLYLLVGRLTVENLQLRASVQRLTSELQSVAQQQPLAGSMPGAGSATGGQFTQPAVPPSSG